MTIVSFEVRQTGPRLIPCGPETVEEGDGEADAVRRGLIVAVTCDLASIEVPGELASACQQPATATAASAHVVTTKRDEYLHMVIIFSRVSRR
jgi:hypothetical protein